MGKSVIQCFFLKPTEQAEESLRRYRVTGGLDCPNDYYHNVSVVIGQVASEGLSYGDDKMPHDDPRWPKTCTCGYVFEEEDDWQHDVTQLYRRSDNGELTTLVKAPPGAMWYADWMPSSWRGPDGRTLVVKTPHADWVVDQPFENGSRWERSGAPPRVTARPSIGQYGRDGKRWAYHGFLTDGQLIEC